MLAPKRVKHRKTHTGRMKGKANSGNYVTFGTYASIAVSWQDPTDSNPATNQHTLGAYGGVYPFFTAYGGTDPTTITVSETNYSKINLDFSANSIYATSSTGGQ